MSDLHGEQYLSKLDEDYLDAWDEFFDKPEEPNKSSI